MLFNLFDTGDDWKPPHIDLAGRADLLVIVPATANIIGKIANGIADDALSTVAISVHCPILLAPAMNGHMYQNPHVKRNVETLSQNGVVFVEPVKGDLACGYQGIGRLNTIEAIVEKTEELLQFREDLIGQRILVTAGATREYIDPVRFITNRSSGKMGYAIAQAARCRGAEVKLVSGQTTIGPPPGIDTDHVETTEQMHEAIIAHFKQADIVILAAAPADFKPAAFSSQKIKKHKDTISIDLEKNPDTAEVLGEMKRHQITVCFAAETNDVLENAKAKMIRKNCDFIVANDILAEGAGFAGDTNIVSILDRDGNCEQLPILPKSEVANAILDRIVKLL